MNYNFSFKKIFVSVAFVFAFFAIYFTFVSVVYAQTCQGSPSPEGQIYFTNPLGSYRTCPAGYCGSMFCTTDVQTCYYSGCGCTPTGWSCSTPYCSTYPLYSPSCDTSTCTPANPDGSCGGGGGGGGGGGYCGDGSCNNGETNSSCATDCPAATNFSIALTPSTRTIYNNGEYGSYTVEVTPSPWQNGQYYAISFVTCPVGLTCQGGGDTTTTSSYSDTTWDGIDYTVYNKATRAIQVTPYKSTPPGTYSFVVRATKNGVSKDVTGYAIITAPNASCTSISVPSSVSPGQSFNATVTMYNNGSISWLNGAYGSARDGAFTYPRPDAATTWGSGSGQFIPQTNYYDTTSVAPGSSYTFTIPSIAPTTPGYYNYSTQMYHYGSTVSDQYYFGAICNGGTITVGTPSAPAVTMTAPTSATVGSSFNVSWTASNSSSVVTSASIMPPTGCTMSSNTALVLSDSRTVTCSSTGTKTFQITVQNLVGTQATVSKSVSITDIPPPTNPTASCPSPGTAGSVSWTLPSGYTQALLRVQDNASSPACSTGTNQLCTGAYTGTSYSFNQSSAPAMVPGHTYSWWVHTYNASLGQYSSAVGGNFTCIAPVVQYTLTVIKTIGGTIRTIDNNISCGTTCSRQYDQGSSVTLQAVPDTAYWRFVGWGGACSGQGTGNCTLTIGGNVAVTAQFRPKSLLYQEF
jgi:hypothetical protein